MQKIIDAEKSDLFDVLAHVAYAVPPLTREQRADQAKPVISSRFDTKQQAFLDFVLSHYVSDGVYELDPEKLTPLLRLRYHDSIADAVADLGQPERSDECSRLPEVLVSGGLGTSAAGKARLRTGFRSSSADPEWAAKKSRS